MIIKNTRCAQGTKSTNLHRPRARPRSRLENVTYPESFASFESSWSKLFIPRCAGGHRGLGDFFSGKMIWWQNDFQFAAFHSFVAIESPDKRTSTACATRRFMHLRPFPGNATGIAAALPFPVSQPSWLPCPRTVAVSAACSRIAAVSAACSRIAAILAATSLSSHPRKAIYSSDNKAARIA